MQGACVHVPCPQSILLAESAKQPHEPRSRDLDLDLVPFGPWAVVVALNCPLSLYAPTPLLHPYSRCQLGPISITVLCARAGREQVGNRPSAGFKVSRAGCAVLAACRWGDFFCKLEPEFEMAVICDLALLCVPNPNAGALKLSVDRKVFPSNLIRELHAACRAWRMVPHQAIRRFHSVPKPVQRRAATSSRMIQNDAESGTKDSISSRAEQATPSIQPALVCLWLGPGEVRKCTLHAGAVRSIRKSPGAVPSACKLHAIHAILGRECLFRH